MTEVMVGIVDMERLVEAEDIMLGDAVDALRWGEAIDLHLETLFLHPVLHALLLGIANLYPAEIEKCCQGSRLTSPIMHLIDSVVLSIP